MELPSVIGLASAMLCWYCHKLPPLRIITLQVSIIDPHQAFGNWVGVAATINVGFRIPKSDAMVRLINLREFLLGLLRSFSSNISEYLRLE